MYTQWEQITATNETHWLRLVSQAELQVQKNKQITLHTQRKSTQVFRRNTINEAEQIRPVCPDDFLVLCV